MKRILYIISLLVWAALLLSIGCAAETEAGDASAADPFSRILIGLAIGFVISLVIVLVMARKMSTVRPAKTADGYVKKNSFRLTESRDIYLYSRVTRVRVNNSSNKRN